MIALGIVAGAIVLLLLVYLFFLIRPHAKQPADKRLLCDYAHRGLHGDGIPENSMAAFAQACQADVGIELDVQLSADGEVMVFHDYTLVRMTGCEKKLGELTKKELVALSLAGTDQTIPTLAEVLALVDGKVPLLVELKGESLNTDLCEKVATLLSSYSGLYCLESFNPLLVGKIRQLLPKAFCGLLYTNVCRDKKKYSALNVAVTTMMLNFVARPHFISYNEVDRASLPVRLTTAFYRCPRFVWTVRSQTSMETAHMLGECPIFENIK